MLGHRLHSVDAFRQSIPTAQVESRGEVCDVVRRVARCRRLRPRPAHRQEESAAAAALRHRHHIRRLLHRFLPGNHSPRTFQLLAFY